MVTPILKKDNKGICRNISSEENNSVLYKSGFKPTFLRAPLAWFKVLLKDLGISLTISDSWDYLIAIHFIFIILLLVVTKVIIVLL